MIYLDLNKQKRTLTPNEFTIPVDSEEAKAFFTPKQPNQDLIVDVVNKTTYFKKYEMQEDGTRYSHYNEDGTPDTYTINKELAKTELDKQISEAKEYLSTTDYKMTIDYYLTLSEEEQVELTNKRAEARTFVRENGNG